jgi:ParB family transcriptional regulator, chromosome partitioning protein
MTHEMVAQSVGKDRSTVSNAIRLLNLPALIQDAVSGGKISMGHARALLAVEDADRQQLIFAQIMAKSMSVRELENLINIGIESTVRRKILKTRARDHEIAALEEELQRLLGTKVRIQAKKKRGKIIIEYYSLDDFDRILHMIKQ